MTTLLREALLDYFRTAQSDRLNDYDSMPTEPVDKAMQAVIQALEVENMRGVRVVKAKAKGGKKRGGQ